MKLNTVINKVSKLENSGKKLRLRFYKRLGVFKNSSGTCGFDPVTLQGHSYGWYSLVKQIDGHLILNTYNYSNQTAKHINKVMSVLHDLGLKYKCIQAPEGLQDLDRAMRHHIYELAKAEIKNDHSRKPNGWGYKWSLKTHTKAIELLKDLGIKAPKSLQLELKKAAIEERERRLERQRERSAALRMRQQQDQIASSLTLVVKE